MTTKVIQELTEAAQRADAEAKLHRDSAAKYREIAANEEKTATTALATATEYRDAIRKLQETAASVTEPFPVGARVKYTFDAGPGKDAVGTVIKRNANYVWVSFNNFRGGSVDPTDRSIWSCNYTHLQIVSAPKVGDRVRCGCGAEGRITAINDTGWAEVLRWEDGRTSTHPVSELTILQPAATPAFKYDFKAGQRVRYVNPGLEKYDGEYAIVQKDLRSNDGLAQVRLAWERSDDREDGPFSARFLQNA